MDLPEIWADLTNRLKPIYGSLIIAGGSVRDSIVIGPSAPFKDVDIFVPCPSELDLEMTVPALNATFGPASAFLMEPDSDKYGPENEILKSNVIGVVEMWVDDGADGYVVNIIAKEPEKIADPSLLLADFDHSLCRAFVDPVTGQAVATEEFAKSLDTGLITVYHKDSERTTKRIDNLLTRDGYRDRFKRDKSQKEIADEAWRLTVQTKLKNGEYHKPIFKFTRSNTEWVAYDNF